MSALRLVSLTALLFAATALHGQWCSHDTGADRVRIILSSDCGNPESFDLRRNGDDGSIVVATREGSGGRWVIDPFTESIGSVTLCTKLCGHASVCRKATPSKEKDANGNNVCVAVFDFRCDEGAWTLAVQSKPNATLSYTRKREEGTKQRGELKAAPRQPAKMCDLAPDETVEIVPKPKASRTYTFAPIAVSQDELVGKKNVWTLGATQLLDRVQMPDGKRSRALTEAERSFVQIDIKELTLTLVSDQPAGGRR